MPKPRIFLSSTCYDLSDTRDELQIFLEGLNFEVLNSQKGKNFGVNPGTHSHDNCLDLVDHAEYLLLIIGGHRGGTYIGSEESITNEEFKRAKKRGIPIIGCVDKKVFDTIPLYKKNPNGDFSSVVKDTRVFHFINYVSSGSYDNWLHTYSKIDDIREIVLGQLSHYLYTYSQNLTKPKALAKKEGKSKKFPITSFPNSIKDFDNLDQDEQTSRKNGFFEVYKILNGIIASEQADSCKNEQLKCIWILGRYGQLSYHDIKLDEPKFKSYTWAMGKGRRVFNQMEDHGVHGEYDHDEEEVWVNLNFSGADDEVAANDALMIWIKALLQGNNPDDAYQLFRELDFRAFEDDPHLPKAPKKKRK